LPEIRCWVSEAFSKHIIIFCVPFTREVFTEGKRGSALSDRIYAKATTVLVTDSVATYNTNIQSNTGYDRLRHWKVTDSKHAWLNFGYQNFQMDNSVLKRTCSVESARIACNTIQLNTLADLYCFSVHVP